MSRNRSNKRYKTLKILIKPSHKKMMIIFDNNDTPLVDNNGLLRRGTEYCNELYNCHININEELIKVTITSKHDTSLPIQESELRNIINTLKNGKAPSIDNIPCELIKYGWELLDIMTSLCQHILETIEWLAQCQITNHIISKER